MFNYKEFKAEMKKRGHDVQKKGKKITIFPNNNYVEYGKGFINANQIVSGFEDFLKFKGMDHFNTHIYSADFVINE